MANRRATLGKNPGDVSSMFDEVASRYDLMNDVASLGQVRVWRAAAVAAVAEASGSAAACRSAGVEVPAGAEVPAATEAPAGSGSFGATETSAESETRILDLAAGTATSTVAYKANGATAIACDFSQGMLAQARKRHPEVCCVAGDAMSLPFADETFDVVTISYGLRNFNDPTKALREMLRVTKPGGRLVIVEFSTPVWGPLRRLYRFYLGRVMPAFSGIFSSDESAYDYLGESILAWPGQNELARVVQSAGWRSVAYRNLSEGIVAIHRATRPVVPARSR